MEKPKVPIPPATQQNKQNLIHVRLTAYRVSWSHLEVLQWGNEADFWLWWMTNSFKFWVSSGHNNFQLVDNDDLIVLQIALAVSILDWSKPCSKSFFKKFSRKT